jgi:hypothetical protein
MFGSSCLLSSNSAEHFASLTYCSWFLQLFCQVLFILHSLCLPFSSLTTMSLVNRPITAPELSWLLQSSVFVSLQDTN